MKHSNLFAFLSFSLLITACTKGSDEEAAIEQNCKKIQQVKIVAEETSVTVGDPIRLRVNEMPDIALYTWIHGNTSPETGDEDYDIEFAEKSDEGWYYLNVSYSDCESHTDSIYITVKNKVVAPPCSPTNNTVSFSTIPDINPASVTWSYNTTWNRRVLAARGGSGYPDFNIYFNTAWDTTEPEDGEYSITTMQATNEYPPYTVYISSQYSSVFFQAGSGKVYVSHVSGKLSVTFCGISLSGSLGGPSYTTTATGTLTAP